MTDRLRLVKRSYTARLEQEAEAQQQAEEAKQKPLEAG